jgi:hypothetical protein
LTPESRRWCTLKTGIQISAGWFPVYSVSKLTIGAVRLHKTWRTDGRSEAAEYAFPLKEANHDIP